MKKDFKVGDKVKVKNNLKELNWIGVGYCGEMKELEGTIVTIKDVKTKGYKIEECKSNYTYIKDAFLPVRFTKSDLQEGDILTLRNGATGVYKYDMDIDGLCKSNIKEDLTNNGGMKEELDIVKVERKITLYERQEEIKEMTLKEVCDALGYDVKIVKEEK